MQNSKDTVTIAQAIDIARKFQEAGQFAPAEEIYNQVLLKHPNHPDALHLLGMIFSQTDRRLQGVELVRRAITIAPFVAELHSNLGTIYDDLGRFDEAINAYRRALELRSDYPEAHNNLGNSLKDSGRVPESIPHYRKAIALRGNYALAHHNLASALFMLGNIPEALASCRRALEIEPALPLAHCTLGLILLALGDLQTGWKEYDARLQIPAMDIRPRNYPQPVWDGSSLNGKRIFLHSEQGFGDTMQFVRYVPMIQQRGGKIILECQPGLVRLLSNLPGIEQIVRDGDPPPPFDVHCSLLSIPRIFGTTLETIPANIPYIHPDPAIVEKWRARVPADGRLKVGLSWAGRKIHGHDRYRSIQLSSLAPLAAAKNVWFCSLQKGDPASQTKSPPSGMDLTDWTPELRDFADTAGLLANLDLLISVDTAVVHLAGAMAKPAWVLLQFMPDWRWMLQREDSPWYPTLRLFRQTKREDWSTPIQDITQALIAKQSATA
jgi:Flp pilus assembly protein TadD